MNGMDPSGSNRLDKIEAALDQLFRQNISILEGLKTLYDQGGERLDRIEEKLERLDEVDHKVYFDSVRGSLFDGMLTQEQVDGQTVILAVWEHGEPKQDDIRKLAYMLSTVHHETAERHWPITEYGSQDYLEGKKYWPYIGRGFVQLTWDYNYEKASQELGLIDKRYLIDYPDLALDSLIATRILFKGMMQGWFTGKQLDEYFNDDKDDPVNARQIINGNDCDDQIAAYHDKFLAALKAARLDDDPGV